MKGILLSVVTTVFSLTAQAQTAVELTKGAIDKSNKDNVRDLVPVWSYSFDDNRSEESQPLVYNGILYVTTNSATMAIDAKTGRQIWKTKVEYPPETPRIVCCGIINGVLPCLTA